MSYYPIFADLRGKRCLVVGGGEVASRKVDSLIKAGGKVVVVAPELSPALAALRDAGSIQHIASRFDPAQLDEAWLVIAATDDVVVNRAVSEQAHARRIPANVVDDPALCSFILPAIVERLPVQIAISTGGASPVLARLLKARLETLIPSAYGRLASLMASLRGQVKQRFSDPDARRRFWENVLHGPIAEQVLAGQEPAALAAIERELNVSPAVSGEVYLVGAGPGDPDLLTFRALRLMQQADVVLYDRLVAPAILDLVRKDAERIYVGKQESLHVVPQDEINQLLASLARQGKRVLRLKGGDPFIFGRGGEEIETLHAEGIAFQVVPGITAASGCASYAGIPLTHRDYAQSCIFVTGHLKDGGMDLDWEMLARPRQTIVVYMGLRGLDTLCRELIAHGLPATMPVALIEQGTTQNQKVFTATLASLPVLIERHEIHPPSLIIVGEVVRLHEKLAWFNAGSDIG